LRLQNPVGVTVFGERWGVAHTAGTHFMKISGFWGSREKCSFLNYPLINRFRRKKCQTMGTDSIQNTEANSMI
jgi:hypothetical protein